MLQLGLNKVRERESLGTTPHFSHVYCYIQKSRVKVVRFQLHELLNADLVGFSPFLLLKPFEQGSVII